MLSPPPEGGRYLLDDVDHDATRSLADEVALSGGQVLKCLEDFLSYFRRMCTDRKPYFRRMQASAPPAKVF